MTHPEAIGVLLRQSWRRFQSAGSAPPRRIPSHWVEGVAYLNPERPPADVPRHRWQQLQALLELPRKLGRARCPTRMGRDGLIWLCAQAAARLFRQRRPVMGHQRRQAAGTASDLGSDRRPREQIPACLLPSQCRCGEDQVTVDQIGRLAIDDPPPIGVLLRSHSDGANGALTRRSQKHLYSITASASRVGSTVMPTTLAVLRLTTSASLVALCVPKTSSVLIA